MSSMTAPMDPRLPVAFIESPGDAGERAVLIEGGQAVPAGSVAARFALTPEGEGHAPGCSCCVSRSPAATALAGLFLAHARGEIDVLPGVAVLAATPEGREQVRAALRVDPLLRARFRLVR